MKTHSFDISVAEKVGVNAAVIYQNLLFWCEKNKANQKNYHECNWWTYNSIKAWCELFPYLTQKQIRTAIDKLTSVEMIKKGNFNKSNYDRTAWYCVEQLRQLDLPSRANGIAAKDEPIPDTKPYSKQDSKCATAQPSFLELRQECFEIWWSVWREGKKACKGSTGAKAVDGKKPFLKTFSEVHVKKIGEQAFREEIDEVCSFTEYALNDLANNPNSEYFNMKTMFPAKFFNKKQWTEIQWTN